MKGDIRCTVVILTRDSEKTLGRALESVKDFSDIIICDGGSTDSTLEIARRYGARVILQDPAYLDAEGRIIDYSGTRNAALKKAQEPWCFFVDSDEYISRELADEIRDVISAKSEGVYVLFRRYVLPDGREVECATTYPNPSVRLFAHASVQGFIKTVHERVKPNSGVVPQSLKGALYVPVGGESGPGKKKGNRYVELEVAQMIASNKSFWRLFSYVAFWHSVVSLRYALRHIRILLFCRGVRMPLSIEMERHRYHLRLIAEMWRRRKHFGKAA